MTRSPAVKSPPYQKRRYTVVEYADRTVHGPLGKFPKQCPSCRHQWMVRFSRVYNGLYDTEGNTAACPSCGIKMYEVSDVWVGAYKR